MVLNSTEVTRPNGVEIGSSGYDEEVIHVDFINKKLLQNPEIADRQKTEQRAASVCRFSELEQLRLLTEVNHLRKARVAPMQFDVDIAREVGGNHNTQSQEIGMPYAITTTRHKVETIDEGDRVRLISYFLGKTAVGIAESGFEFHGDIAHPRVEVEKAEAIASEDMEPGMVYALISPKMTRAEATYDQAKQEHLADDDAIRISYLDDSGEIRIMQSMLVRDIPLQAWVDMLADPNNIFGKSISVEDPEKSLSVMKVFNQLTVPIGTISSPLDITKCAVSYIHDPKNRKKVQKQLERYKNQEEMEKDAVYYGREWLQHSQELAESLETGVPTNYVKSFVYGKNQHIWSNEDLEVIDASHDAKGNLVMTKALAAIIENLQRKFMEMRISSRHAPEFVSDQIGFENLQKIQRFEEQTVSNVAVIEQQRMINMQTQHSFLSSLQFKSADRGCAGGGKNSEASNIMQNLGITSENNHDESITSSNTEKITFNKKGVCRVQSCKTRPGQTDVGPCSVCKTCQAKFDDGKDPTKEPAYVPKEKTQNPKSGFLFMKNESMLKVA